LYDAKWQNPFQSAKKITRVLEGKHKPIYHPMNDCGDHVVVINSRHIALLGREWQFRVYFHHPGISIKKLIAIVSSYNGTTYLFNTKISS
jgi:large subunit ribosomal protein L13